MAITRRYTLRFNLAAGATFMNWQLIDKVTGKKSYHAPNSVQFKLFDCKLVNQKATAKKIHAGAHKAVCAWIEFNWFELIDSVNAGTLVAYNPRVVPNWTIEGDNVDDMIFESLATLGNRVYL
jgi:hypothetical protein